MDHLRLSLDPRAMDALPSALGPLYVSRDAGLNGYSVVNNNRRRNIRSSIW